MESEESLVVSALSVDEAVILGLTRLAATRDEVVIEILDEGSRGFLGLGAREARVRLTRRAIVPDAVPATPKPEPRSLVEPEPEVASVPESVPTVQVVEAEPEHPDGALSPRPESPVVAEAAPVAAPSAAAAPSAVAETSSVAAPSAAPEAPAAPRKRPRPKRDKDDGLASQEEEAQSADGLDRHMIAQTAMEVAQNLFADLSVQCTTSWEREDRPTLWIAVRGKDASMLVGPRAQTLDSVQYLFRTLLHRLVDGNYNVVVDADGYRKRRRRSLESLARKMADQAVSSGRVVRLRPMPAHERRVIHILLRKDKRVKTESTGRGRDRAITIVPNK